MNRTKLFLVDDHKIFRQGLKSIIKNFVDVVGEAENGKEFIDKLADTEIDIVLMDISMPIMDGIEATKKALALKPDLKILALSMFGDEEYYYQMIHSGVKGFVLKSSGINELEKAISEVAAGESYFSNELLRKIISNLGKVNNNNTENDSEGLTKRELEVLKLVCGGCTNIEIAEELNISEATVKGHRTKILNKTSCKNTANLVMHAIKNKLVEL